LRSVGYEPTLGGSNASQPLDSGSSGLTNTHSQSTVAVTRISQALESGDTGAGDCNLCNRSFVDKHGLKKHTNMVHSEEGDLLPQNLSTGQQYNCSDCDRTFGYLVNLKKHRWLRHKKRSRKVVDLTVPNSNHLPPAGAPQVTTTYSYTETGDIIVQQHVTAPTNTDPSTDENLPGIAMSRQARKKLDQEEKLKDLKCRMCGFQGKSWKNLETHLMSHSAHRPYKCKECGKGFKEQQKLDRHQLTHTKEKAFKCSYCEKTFGLKHNMKTHQRIHEGGGFQCNYCGRMFSQKGTLADHEAKHRLVRHVRTSDPAKRRNQLISEKRGRKSLADTLFGIGETLSSSTKKKRKVEKESLSASKPEDRATQEKENVGEMEVIDREMEQLFEDKKEATEQVSK